MGQSLLTTKRGPWNRCNYCLGHTHTQSLDQGSLENILQNLSSKPRSEIASVVKAISSVLFCNALGTNHPFVGTDSAAIGDLESSKRVPVLGIFITAKGITMAYAFEGHNLAGSHQSIILICSLFRLQKCFLLITYFLVYFFICRTTPLSDSEILNKMYFPVNRKSCAIEKACFQL